MRKDRGFDELTFSVPLWPLEGHLQLFLLFSDSDVLSHLVILALINDRAHSGAFFEWPPHAHLGGTFLQPRDKLLLYTFLHLNARALAAILPRITKSCADNLFHRTFQLGIIKNYYRGLPAQFQMNFFKVALG